MLILQVVRSRNCGDYDWSFQPAYYWARKLLDAVAKEGVDSYRIYPSRTVDPKKNPLEPEVKVRFTERDVPESLRRKQSSMTVVCPTSSM